MANFYCKYCGTDTIDADLCKVNSLSLSNQSGQKFVELQQSVKELIEEINPYIENAAKEIKCLFKGWRILYSPLVINPTVLFVGINPGEGMTGCHIEDDTEIFEYVDETEYEPGKKICDYYLAKRTRELFRVMDLEWLLKDKSQICKTNYYYMTTPKENDVYKITDFLNSKVDGLGKKVLEKAWIWSSQFIEMVKPKLIICEGSSAYKKVSELEFESNWEEKVEEGIKYRVSLDDDLIIIGSNRNQNRNLRPEEEVFASVLKHLIKNVLTKSETQRS